MVAVRQGLTCPVSYGSVQVLQGRFLSSSVQYFLMKYLLLTKGQAVSRSCVLSYAGVSAALFL